MHYLLERIEKICSEIDKYIYREKLVIDNFRIVEGKYDTIDIVNEIPQEQWNDFSEGQLWGGMDKHAWFKCSVIVPESFKGKTIALNFYTYNENWDNVTNPQFILYVNGEKLQGLDVNHKEFILTNDALPGTIYNIDLHAYAGRVFDRKVTLGGKLVVLDKQARELYYNLKVPVDVCKELDKEDKNRIDMLTVLNDAINLIDLRIPKSEQYDKSIIETNDYLAEKFYGELCGHSDVIATCVGHTHIDVAWLWTVAQTREKVARSFSTVLKLMEEYPEYIFMSSQPQLYKFLKTDHPDLYEKIKEKIKDGVWEPEGSMWLEADCNVTSGESLVRQILHGKRFFKEEFNVDNEILWLPDVFGYSAALPQILKKSGIKYFMTTKIAWNQFNKIPNDTFMWEGIDGSEILTHFITTTLPNQSKESFFTTYNGHIRADAIMGAWRRYQNKNINNDVLVSFGWGDGGGGATYEMLETGRRLAKGIPGAPRVQMGTSLDYFKRLEKNLSSKKKVPKWVGELYLEYHRGTYTSMARNKRDNRKCENLYVAAEKMNSLAMLEGGSYPYNKIRDSWETILLNQFHDIIPGSSIKDVYDVTEVEYKELLENGNEILNSGLEYISSNINLKDRSVIVFNSLGFNRSDIASFEIPEGVSNVALLDEAGREIVCQKVEDNKAIFFARNIPANGYKSFKIIESENSNNKIVTLNKDGGENKFVKFKFDDKEQITSIIDKKTNREVLKKGEVGNQIQAFEDKPMFFDNWDIDIYYKEKMWLIDNISSIEVVEEGPVRSTLRIERKFLNSTIVQNIHLYNDISRIDFDSYIDWKEFDIVVKTLFPLDINAKEATYEIQYGNITRSTHENTSWDLAQFESCGHKWVDLSEGDFGVSMLNDCKYGYDIKNGNMRLTMLKCGTEPNPVADQEEHRFTYSIYVHEGTWKEAKTTQMAYSLNTELFTKVESAHAGILNNELSLVNIDKNNVMIEVIKKAEDSDDIIIRLYEYENKRSNCTLEFSKDIAYVYESDMMENNISKLETEEKRVRFTIKPYEIKTFKVKLG